MAVWLYKIFETRQWPFSKNQNIFLLPIFAILFWGIISFLFSPFPWASFNELLKRVLYVGIALIAASEMTSLKKFQRLSKWLILVLAVCTIYGLIQWIDFNFFPPAPKSTGIDKFNWRGIYGERIFSTFGNPNFYGGFLVALLPLVALKYWREKKMILLLLMGLTLLNIYWTRSKGPFIGILAEVAVFGIFFAKTSLQTPKVRKLILVICASLAIGLTSLVCYKLFYTPGNLSSLSLRIYTWLSTWEMIKTKPFLGNGIGSFESTYPSYRRPAIFHIEGIHHTQTNHAENEYLEIWSDEGIIGLGIWIWLILNIVIGLSKTLKQLTANPIRAGPIPNLSKVPEDVIYLLAFTSGMIGMLVHNMSDISMRIVSSGTIFWLLIGLNSALIIRCPLPEEDSTLIDQDPPIPVSPPNPAFLQLSKGISVLLIIVTAVSILRLFEWCQMWGNLYNGKELPHFLITWIAFLICWGAAAYGFIRLSLKATQVKSIVILILTLPLIVWFFGFFLGDINLNRAIAFSKEKIYAKSPIFDKKIRRLLSDYQVMYHGRGHIHQSKISTVTSTLQFFFPETFWWRNGIGGAFEHYYETQRLSPYNPMAPYFLGNHYLTLGSEYAKSALNSYEQGDINKGNDFRHHTENLWKNSLEAYADTRKLAPNFVQMHYKIGTVHKSWGDFLFALAEVQKEPGLSAQTQDQAKDHWKKALGHYKVYHKLDPVFDENYYRTAETSIQLGDNASAEKAYLENIQGDECKKAYNLIPYTNGFEDKYHGSINSRYDLNSPRHTHDRVINPKPEGWMYLGNFYFHTLKDAKKAEEAYKKAVACTPDEVYQSGHQASNQPESYIKFPEHITFLKLLANVYAYQGKTKLARETWQRVQNLEPEDPDLKKMINLSSK